jgi:hypothetical protein
MKISTMVRITRPVALTILPFLFIFMIGVPVGAQERRNEGGRLENARWRVAGDVVVITYTLIGDSELTYDVSITLTKGSDRSFRIAPRTVSGAIGKGKYAGVGMEIQWEYKKDVAQMLEGDDYAFEFVINVVREERGSNFLYYLMGGLGLVGGVAALVLGGGNKAEAAGPTASGLPNPPAERPPSQ